MTDLLQDLRHIVRSLMRARTFALMTIATLAIGIAANVTIFAVLDAVLLRPLPFREPSQLAHIAEVTPDGLDFSVSEPNYLDFRAQQRTLIDVAALRYSAFDLVAVGEPVRLTGAAVSASFFSVLGVAPAAGRTFTAAEDMPGGDDVVVLGHGLWTSRFGANPGCAEHDSAIERTPAHGDRDHACGFRNGRGGAVGSARGERGE